MIHAPRKKSNEQPGGRLVDFLSLASLAADAGRYDHIEQFLEVAASTARQSFGSKEAFIVLEHDDVEPLAVVTGGARLSPSYAHEAVLRLTSVLQDDPHHLARSLGTQLRALGTPVLIPIVTETEPIGVLGLFEAPPLSDAEGAAVGRGLGTAISNFRLYQEARSHLARQSLLRDLGRVFSATGGLGEKLIAFLTRIQLLRPVDGCYFSLFDRNSGPRWPVNIFHLHSSTRSMAATLEQDVVDRSAPVSLEDLGPNAPFRSYLGLPLTRRGAVIGVLSLCARPMAAFSRQDVEFFTAVSEHTALLLDNAWLLEETQKQVEELTFMFSVSGVLRREKTPQAVMEAVLEHCVHSVRADRGYLLAFDAQTSSLTAVAACGDTLPEAPPISGSVLPVEKIRYSEDPRAEFPAFFEHDAVETLTDGLARLLLVPLCTDRGLHGVMLVGHRAPGRMSESDRRLLMTLTNAAENAVGRAMGVEEMQARIREEAASRAKSEFLAIMSHELRTPLTSILGFTELLADNHFGPTNPKQQEYLHEVLGSARHLLLLINDILDLAKVEAGKVELEVAEVDVPSLLQEVLRSFAPVCHRKRLQFGVEACGVRPVKLIADMRRIKQILFNLVGNAVKFTDEGGRVHIRVAAEHRWVHFEVEDSGIGIHRDELERIFKPFSQARRPAGRVYEGTGLGLSLSLRLAELHGGTLYAVSEPGAGSVFHVVLPEGGPP